MKKKNLIYYYLLALLFFFSSPLTIANESDSTETEKLFALSIDDFLNLKVSVSSKKEEPIQDAPGIITVYNHSDIKALGYYSLSQLSQITSGYGSSPSQYNEKGLETRGQASSAFENDKHLILIDDIPINFVRSYKAPIDNDLPLFFADRIELLKGPGSALYGISAFSGVINIKSKDGTSNDLYESMISTGTQDFTRRFMGNVYKKSQNGNFNLSVGYFQKDHSAKYLGNNLNSSSFLNWDEQKSFFGKTSYRIETGKLSGLTLGTILLQRHSGLGEYWWGPSSSINQITWTSFIPYLKYERRINSLWKIKSYLKYNLGDEEGVFSNLTPNQNLYNGNQDLLSKYRRRSSSCELNIESYYTTDYDLEIIVGSTIDERGSLNKQNSYNATLSTPDTNQANLFSNYSPFQETDWNITTYSFYTQLQYKLQFLNGLMITAGAREDLGISGEFTYNQLSPRVALVQKITPKFNIKMLYGRALKTPSLKSIGLNEEAKTTLSKNNIDYNFINNVDAEKIVSYEIGCSYTSNKIMLSYNIFYNRTNDRLDKTAYSTTLPNGTEIAVNTFSNSKTRIDSRGSEFDFKYQITKKLQITANLSYAKAIDSEKNIFENMPITKSNLIVVYKFPEYFPLEIALINKNIICYRNEGTPNVSTKSRYYFDANLRYPIYKNISLEVLVSNILNNQYFDPGYNYDNNQLYIPLPRRNFLFSVVFSL